jgi:hypothetical protein
MLSGRSAERQLARSGRNRLWGAAGRSWVLRVRAGAGACRAWCFTGRGCPRAIVMLCSSLSTPVTFGTAHRSSRVSRPVPQPTSSARSHPAGIASKITRW